MAKSVSVCRLWSWRPLLFYLYFYVVAIITNRTSVLLWPLDAGGTPSYTLFLSFFVLSSYNFLATIIKGPGYLPLQWTPDKGCTDIIAVIKAHQQSLKIKENFQDASQMEFCVYCMGFKAPRSHHCRRCDRCILKMDHHCWIMNVCCGHHNQANFVYTSFFISCFSLQAIIVLLTVNYKRLQTMLEVNAQSLYSHDYLHLCVINLTLVATSSLLLFSLAFFTTQMQLILKNQTSIESRIIKQVLKRSQTAGESPFIFPYNLDWKENLKLVFTNTVCDGIHWALATGASPYFLTILQKKQKERMEKNAVLYEIVENYNGAFYLKNLHLLESCLITPKLAVGVGDQVKVTKWKRNWIFGIKFMDLANQRLQQGWFPRRCGVYIHRLYPTYQRLI